MPAAPPNIPSSVSPSSYMFRLSQSQVNINYRDSVSMKNEISSYFSTTEDGIFPGLKPSVILTNLSSGYHVAYVSKLLSTLGTIDAVPISSPTSEIVDASFTENVSNSIPGNALSSESNISTKLTPTSRSVLSSTSDVTAFVPYTTDQPETSTPKITTNSTFEASSTPHSSFEPEISTTLESFTVTAVDPNLRSTSTNVINKYLHSLNATIKTSQEGLGISSWTTTTLDKLILNSFFVHSMLATNIVVTSTKMNSLTPSNNPQEASLPFMTQVEDNSTVHIGMSIRGTLPRTQLSAQSNTPVVYQTSSKAAPSITEASASMPFALIPSSWKAKRNSSINKSTKINSTIPQSYSLDMKKQNFFTEAQYTLITPNMSSQVKNSTAFVLDKTGVSLDQTKTLFITDQNKTSTSFTSESKSQEFSGATKTTKRLSGTRATTMLWNTSSIQSTMSYMNIQSINSPVHHIANSGSTVRNESMLNHGRVTVSISINDASNTPSIIHLTDRKQNSFSRSFAQKITTTKRAGQIFKSSPSLHKTEFVRSTAIFATELHSRFSKQTTTGTYLFSKVISAMQPNTVLSILMGYSLLSITLVKAQNSSMSHFSSIFSSKPTVLVDHSSTSDTSMGMLLSNSKLISSLKTQEYTLSSTTLPNYSSSSTRTLSMFLSSSEIATGKLFETRIQEHTATSSPISLTGEPTFLTYISSPWHHSTQGLSISRSEIPSAERAVISSQNEEHKITSSVLASMMTPTRAASFYSTQTLRTDSSYYAQTTSTQEFHTGIPSSLETTVDYSSTEHAHQEISTQSVIPSSHSIASLSKYLGSSSIRTFTTPAKTSSPLNKTQYRIFNLTAKIQSRTFHEDLKNKASKKYKELENELLVFVSTPSSI